MKVLVKTWVDRDSLTDEQRDNHYLRQENKDLRLKNHKQGVWITFLTATTMAGISFGLSLLLQQTLLNCN